ncbi:MAG: hypothetical protein JNK82_11435, partial [Myxococcaceae bacterium]|nr:hypothetical protein [Myxococcaceae bacterium]
SCDPEDGKCKCGGRGGTVCGVADGGSVGEVCVSTALQQSCRRPCSAIASDCTAPQQCFFDTAAATPVAYCAVPTGMQLENQACQRATACFSGMPARPQHCNGLTLNTTGICRPYCDTGAGMSGCLQVPMAQICTGIALAPSGSNYGVCQVQ